MFRSISDFSSAWKMESEKTLQIFRTLTDASLAQKVTSEGRSLGFIAHHITSTAASMLTQAGVPASSGDRPPATAAALVEAYAKIAEQVTTAIPAKWKDNMLAEVISVYGQTWTRAGLLNALIAHQTHHRGQMTVLMRQAGLKIPGVYGPSKEEWSQIGMPTPA